MLLSYLILLYSLGMRGGFGYFLGWFGTNYAKKGLDTKALIFMLLRNNWKGERHACADRAGVEEDGSLSQRISHFRGTSTVRTECSAVSHSWPQSRHRMRKTHCTRNCQQGQGVPSGRGIIFKVVSKTKSEELAESFFLNQSSVLKGYLHWH